MFVFFAFQSRRRRVYNQFRRNGISSTRSVVYHQAAGGCTLTRDEIQGRLAAFDDIHDCVVMICQALDKKTSCSRIEISTARGVLYLKQTILCENKLLIDHRFVVVLRIRTAENARGNVFHVGIGIQPRGLRYVPIDLIYSVIQSERRIVVTVMSDKAALVTTLMSLHLAVKTVRHRLTKIMLFDHRLFDYTCNKAGYCCKYQTAYKNNSCQFHFLIFIKQIPF